MNRSWVIITFFHLEQLPNAFSVLRKLPELSLTWKKLLLDDVKLFTGHILIWFLITFVHFVLIFTILFLIFGKLFSCWLFFAIAGALVDRRNIGVFVCAISKRNSLKTTLFFFELRGRRYIKIRCCWIRIWVRFEGKFKA